MNHDDDTFNKIYEEFQPRIYRYLCRMVGEAEAEDLTQEVFMKVNKALPGFRGESSMSTWVYTIATNTALDNIRSSSSRNASQHADISEADKLLPGDEAADQDIAVHLPDTLLIRKDMNNCIRGIVESLPELYRTSLVLSDLEGMTNSEIAEVLKISLDAVKIRLHRARAMLRREMEKKCDFYRDSRNELACDRKAPVLKFRPK